MIDWDSYRDPLGFISGEYKPKGSSGNALLFAAHERRLRILLNDWTEKQELALLVRVRRHCEKYTGLLTRPPPYQLDQESLDDYIGYAAISPYFAADALRFGRSHSFRPKAFGGLLGFRYHYSLGGDEQDVNAWLGRFPAVIAHFEWRTGERPPLWRRLYWFFSVALSGSKENQDPWIHSWHLIGPEAEKTWLGRIASRRYRQRLEREWGSLFNVFARYFNDVNHPIVKACEQLGI